MVTTIKVIFDGEVFRPETPPDLEPNTSYTFMIQPADKAASEDLSTLLGRLAGTVEAPADWSAEHDHYLYGTPKNDEADSAA